MTRRAIYTSENFNQLRVRGEEWDFEGDNSAHPLHAIHPYPARFVPQIPRMAIERWCPAGGTVLDIFGGVGTTALEAQLMGRPSISIDSNPVANLVSEAKTYRYSRSDISCLVAIARTLQNDLSGLPLRPELLPLNPRFSGWFEEPAMQAILKIKGFAENLDEPIKKLALTSLSAVLVRVSKQDSDTRYARVEKPSLEVSDVERIFTKKFVDSIRAVKDIHPKVRPEAAIILGDSREAHGIEDCADLIVTSPPYLNAYDYHKYHRQRIVLIDGNVEFARKAEIGGHDRYTKPGADPKDFFQDLELCLQQSLRALKTGGRALFLIGDAIVGGQPVAVGDELARIAQNVGFALDWRAIRKIQTSRKSFNASARIDHEHLIVLIKR